MRHLPDTMSRLSLQTSASFVDSWMPASALEPARSGGSSGGLPF
jgi:hypothetical protein